MDGVGIRYIEFSGFPENTIPASGFTDFGAVSAGSPNIGPFDTAVVFVGQPVSGPKGIVVQGHPSGTLVHVGQTLDGKIVQDVDLGRDSEFGVSVAFWASFTDGSQGIFHAIVPEPATTI